jgi:hypothetical protein
MLRDGIQDNLKDVKSRQETYANKRRQTLEIQSRRLCVLEGLATSDHSPSSRSVGLWLISLTCHQP